MLCASGRNQWNMTVSEMFIYLDMYMPCKGKHINGLILVQATQHCSQSLYAMSTLQ